MAGLQLAETLAHRTEDYVRALTRNELPLSDEGFGALTTATERLEQIVVAHREKKTAPDIAGLLNRFGSLLEESQDATPTAARLPAGLEQRVADARARGLRVWHCFFEPSAVLAEKSVTVNSARARAQELGEILHSAPKIEPGGKISFEFVVASSLANVDQARWEGEGIRIFEYTTPAAAPASAAAIDSPPPVAFVAPSHVVRVDLTRLDELMRIMGDMVVHRARLEEVSNRVAALLPTNEARALQEVNIAFGRELRNLRDGLMRVRLVPVGEIFQRLPFVVRDLAHETGKRIRLSATGQETEIDKYLVERLKDPLLHLVRNSVAHGIETSEERVAAGKPPEATISMRASTVGETVLIEISDDGRGVDLDRVVARARGAGMVVADRPDSADLLELISQPGFSTRDAADRGAGRGVGMGAVQEAVRDMGGELTMRTEPGQGTTFTLRLPLTLAIADALIIAAGGQRFAMPQSVVQEITTAAADAVKSLERNEIMAYRNGILPLIRLSTVFGLTPEPRREFPVLVLGTGLNAVGIVADRVIGQREIVVRGVNDPLLKVPAISGATELGDGRAVLILDTNGLIQTARLKRERHGATAQWEKAYD
jgi:two-component system chemotaxis sensor kinase CheA